jgi:hypothetical protein
MHPHLILYIYRNTTKLSVGRVAQSVSDWLPAGWSGDRIPVEAKFSAPVQTGTGSQSAFCTMGFGSIPRIESGRVVTLTPHPF